MGRIDTSVEGAQDKNGTGGRGGHTRVPGGAPGYQGEHQGTRGTPRDQGNTGTCTAWRMLGVSRLLWLLYSHNQVTLCNKGSMGLSVPPVREALG